MASDLAAAQSHAQSPSQPQDQIQIDSHAPTVLTNGNHSPVHNETPGSETINNDAFTANSTLSSAQPSLGLKDNILTSAPEPSAPTPVETPITNPNVTDIVAKDPPTNSHPTPPPDPPLVAPSDPKPDVVMANSEPESKLTNSTTPPLATEPSLVRPREDDDQDEEQRAAKRSKLESEATPAPVASDSLPAATPELPPTISESSAPAPVLPPVEPESKPVEQSVEQPSAPLSQPTPLESTQPEPEPIATPAAEPIAESITAVQREQPTQEVKSEPPQTQTSALETAPQHIANGELAKSEPAPAAPTPSGETDVKPSVEGGATITAPATTTNSKYSAESMTPAQKAYLLDKWKNIKKTKHALNFLKPVDYVAFNLPHYPDIVKNPMDLGTMEQKLKDDKYNSVQEFADDFDLILNNCRLFNGEAHLVTQAGYSMKAYFDKFMEMVPRADAPLPSKTKKRSPSLGKAQPRREARNVPVAPPAAAPDTFALNTDGTPQIRRDSSYQRPARAIKPPPTRELTYAKPKRKEHQLELKFCEYVLDEIRGPRYQPHNTVFLAPVDPVALNIPHYRQVIKHPMDLGTMTQKLKQGQYGKASEVKKDFELTISNCLLFNPPPNPIRDYGVQLQRDFNTLWAQKEKWEHANRPESQHVSSDEESAGEEEDDEDDEKERTIAALQKQLETMQNMIVGLTGSKPPKAKKSKKSGSKKMSGVSAPTKSKSSASKSKPAKKPKQVTYEEKQEISEAVGRMNETQVNKLTQIITENCARYRDMEEMELEIDDLPNDVQALLLKYVRSLFGNPNKANRAVSPDDIAAVDDDDFEPRARSGGAGGGKRKKHKPMGKHEQSATIQELHARLAQFGSGGNLGSSASPTNQHADTSGDEDSEESEEE